MNNEEIDDLDEQLEKSRIKSNNMEIENSKISQHDYSYLAKKIENYSCRMTFDMKVYIYNNNDIKNIRDKYEILNELKESTFSHVYLARNIKTDKLFCIKKIKDDKNFLDQSLTEIYILDYLRKTGDPSKNNFLDLHEYFYFNVKLKATFVYRNGNFRTLNL